MTRHTTLALLAAAAGLALTASMPQAYAAGSTMPLAPLAAAAETIALAEKTVVVVRRRPVVVRPVVVRRPVVIVR